MDLTEMTARISQLVEWLRYGLNDRCSIPCRGNYGIFFSPPRSDQLYCPPSLISNGYWGLFSGIKRPKHEADNSHPSTVEVKNAWSYNSIPPYVFMKWSIIKQRDKFTFTLERKSWEIMCARAHTPIKV
jgi:hypothetical protein